MDEGTRVKVREAVRLFAEALTQLSWKNPVVDAATGVAKFRDLENGYVSAASATSSNPEKVLYELKCGFLPRLCDKIGVAYDSSALKNDPGWPWHEVGRDEVVLREVSRLVKEAREAKKTNKRTRLDVRRVEARKKLKQVHEANQAQGLTADQSLDLLEEALKELLTQRVLAT